LSPCETKRRKQHLNEITNILAQIEADENSYIIRDTQDKITGLNLSKEISDWNHLADELESLNQLTTVQYLDLGRYRGLQSLIMGE